MGTSSSDLIHSLGTTAQIIPPGLTLAVYFDEALGENAMALKYGAGGTLWLQGVGTTLTSAGAQALTMSVATMASMPLAHYLVGTNETINLDGCPRFYLAATAATTTVYLIRAFNQ